MPGGEQLKNIKCKRFWGIGYCAYGVRCRFIHNEFVANNSILL
jgi:hypothetical protein